MKHILIFTFLLIIGVCGAVAAPRDTSSTKEIALNFYSYKTRGISDRSPVMVQLAYTRRIQTSASRDSVDCIRIYNVGDGFVIVSADDCFEPVLGYSTEGHFEHAHLPEAFLDILNDYANEMKYTLESNASFSAQTRERWEEFSVMPRRQTMRLGTPVVGPLLSTTWNQSAYYNDLCPADPAGPNGHTFAGCVATAMAQLIRYWQYPSHGIGSHSYTSNYSHYGYGDYGVLSVDFAHSTYDYAHMPNSINSNSSVTEIFEVAQLIYHCGVSVNMQYGANMSGAVSEQVAQALNTFFGYEGCYHLDRPSYSEETWISMLKASLNNLQPMLYHGSGSGGHAFVCDGYDSDNYFHFNWGWGGYLDGYFLISALNPGGNNFSSNQGAVFGINANMSIIRPDVKRISFLTEYGSVSETKPVSVLTNALSAPVNATVSGPFQISLDSVNFASSLSLNSTGGTLYVRYEPSSIGHPEHGSLCLASGATVETIMLSGNCYQVNCPPPTNLLVTTQDLQNIDLSWDAAILPLDQQTITWYPGGFCSGVRYGSDVTVSVLQRFCDSDLVVMHGKSLTEIDFYVYDMASSYKLEVYKGGSYDGSTFNPGTLVYTQDVPTNSLTAGSWNTVSLNNPVEIDASQDMCFGIRVETVANLFAVSICSGTVQGKGGFYGFHYENGQASWGHYPNHSVCVKGIVEDRHTLTNYQVYRDETLLTTTNLLSQQDHVEETNTYLYTVVANWSNGCSASIQSSFTNVTQISTLPDRLDFYTNYGLDYAAKKMIISGIALTEDIQVSVDGNFLLSTDSVHFTSTAMINRLGGTLYVKYIPVTENTPFERGTIHLQSGNISAVVPLTGQYYAACNPPQNLLLSQSEQSVALSWDAPEIFQPEQYEISWNNTWQTSYGYNSAVKRYMMHRYETSDLIEYHNKQLTAITFKANTSVNVYKIVVFKGGSYNGSSYNPGNLVVEQNVDISTLTDGDWNTVALNNPVLINANEELWYGLYLEVPGGVYPFQLGPPYVAHKGCITKLVATYNTSWGEFNTSYSFVLKARIEDVPISCISYQVERNEVNVQNTSNTYYNDNVPSAGLYNYAVWSVWDNGCKAPAQGSVEVTIPCNGPTYNILDTLTICASELPITWNGVQFTPAPRPSPCHPPRAAIPSLR